MQVVGENLSVRHGDDLTLHLRNKRPADADRFAADRIVIFMHGATYPSTVFDVPLGGMSWMDYMAGRGFDVYAFDLPGYGRSTRPPAMEQPAEQNDPCTRGSEAVRALGSVVDFVRARRGAEKINLVGWSWGTTLTATYTSLNQHKVERLALFAPTWFRTTPSPLQVQGTLGAYRVVTRDQALARWLAGVPEAKRQDLIPKGWFEQWADATFATDPKGGGKTLRAPNGVVKDGLEFHGATPPRPYYDPARITSPVLLVLGEWDQDTPPTMAQALYLQLINAAWKRLTILGEGTHTIVMEKNRTLLFGTVQQFLEEPAPMQGVAQ